MSASAWNPDVARAIVDRWSRAEGPLLPVLQEAQAAFGHVPDVAIDFIAEALNLSRAEVFGVVSFYPDLRTSPPGRRVVRVCRAEACQAMGAPGPAEALLAFYRMDWGETSRDGALTVEPAYCLGLCAAAPAALIDGVPLGRLTAETLRAAVEGRPEP
jgi:formate dehydrogenase subunit gamma